MMTDSHPDRSLAFMRLHERGCFVMPNPWDAGSAKLLAQLGFPAVATTSAGFAWTLGRRDGEPSLEVTLAHFRELAAAVEVPVNGDFINAFAVDPEDVGRNVAAAATTGIAGVSVEDGTGDPSDPLYDRALAVERIRAAREAIDRGGRGVLLTARSEGFIAGRPDLEETIRRLRAFAEAGADCLFAPGVRERKSIAAVVAAVAPKPVNVLVNGSFTTVAELAALGVRRISVGAALARVALGGFLAAAAEIAGGGTFTAFDAAIPSADVQRGFGR